MIKKDYEILKKQLTKPLINKTIQCNLVNPIKDNNTNIVDIVDKNER